jgi:hypothetical protein
LIGVALVLAFGWVATKSGPYAPETLPGYLSNPESMATEATDKDEPPSKGKVS